MAVAGVRVSVTDAATALDAATDDAYGGEGLVVRNRSQVAIDIGGSDVVVGSGFELLPGASPDWVGDTVTVPLSPQERAYGRAATAGPHRVDVLRVSV